MTEPMWVPDATQVAATRMDRFRREAEAAAGRDLPGTVELHEWSVREPDAFWRLVWDFFGIVGEPGSVAAVPSTLPDAVFFPDASLNLAENLLALAPAEGPAVITLTEAGDGVAITGEITRDELVARVAAMAAALRQRGVRPGDRVAIVLPVGVDALTATLGALAVGGAVTTAAPEFGSTAILDRFGQLDPVVLIATTSYAWAGRRHDRTAELVEIARSLESLKAVIVVPGVDDPTSPVDPDVVESAGLAARMVAGSSRLLRVDLMSEALAEHAGAQPHYERLPFDHPAYVMFSSGTTGKPKCLVHRAGGVLLKNLTESALHCDVRPGDRMMFFTTTGWMMWNWTVSALATGATIVMYDGAPNHPDLLSLFTTAAVTSATHLGLSARLLDVMRTSDEHPGAVPGLDSLRSILITGSPLSELTATWLSGEFDGRVLVAPISGGTDLLGCFCGSDPTRPAYPGEMQGPILGIDFDVVDDDGNPCPPGATGELVCRQPFPSVPLGIWDDDDRSRLISTYFDTYPGIWRHGDLASWTERGGIVIHGRSDATLNAGGVRIGTGEIYGALDDIPELAELLAFGQNWDGDTRVVLLVVLAPGASLDDQLRNRIKTSLRTRCSPRHVPAKIVAVESLPRTLTGKIAEIAAAEAVNGRPVRGRDALANPEVLDVIAALPDLQD